MSEPLSGYVILQGYPDTGHVFLTNPNSPYAGMGEKPFETYAAARHIASELAKSSGATYYVAHIVGHTAVDVRFEATGTPT